MNLPDVSHLERELNMERVAFSGLRRNLAAALRPFKAPEQAEDHIVSYAEEFGAEHAAKVLATKPDTFGLLAKPNDPALLALQSNIEALHASREAMDEIVSKRENILAMADPKRERVYISFGREFTIDMVNQKVRYVDTGRIESLVMKEVAPRNEPTHHANKTNGNERERNR